MPSRLVTSNPSFRERDRAKADAYNTLTTVTFRGPHQGYQPDLPVHLSDQHSAHEFVGLLPRTLTSASSEGEVLMTGDGWVRVDEDRLPLGTDATGATSSTIVNTEVVHLAQFNRTNDSGVQTGEYDKTVIAWTAGDGSTGNTAAMWKVNPSTLQWERVAHSGYAGTTTPKGDRDAMPDSATFAAGAPQRTSFSSASGGTATGIDQPAFLITNNIDPVYVFPADSTDDPQDFEDLTEHADLDPFLAKSVEVFNNRVYFLNTSEAGSRFPQRIRRTPPYTCDPDPSQTGAGSHDLKDFSGQGLRLLRMGNVMACYFEDGVSFLRPTGQAIAPDSFQLVSNARGLISTHAVVDIGNGVHFGIFTDGWFLLDESGQWTEVGVTSVNGIRYTKWKETFYSILGKEPTKRARLYVDHKHPTNHIVIAIPSDAADENEVVWIYDLESDRVFTDEYEALCFGKYDRQTSAGLTYAAATQTYQSIAPATYASLANRFGLQALAHGTSNGYVMQHEEDATNRDREASTGDDPVTYRWKSHYLAGDSPRFLNVVDRVLIEYINMSSPGIDVEVDDTVNSQQRVGVDIDDGSPGEIHTKSVYLRFSAPQVALQLSGSGPVMLKSWEVDFFNELVENLG